MLNAQLDRLEPQTATRDTNGRYLATRLSRIPGVQPQAVPPAVSRHAYHLFMLRLDSGAFGASRDAVVRALEAEGVPCSSGYCYPLYRQPLFQTKAFGPYLSSARERLDYGAVSCPNSEQVCEQSIWIEQAVLLGPREDMDDIARAFEKLYEHRAALAAC